MAYFPNGTSGMLYQEEYCSKCKHDKDEQCPIWNAHILYGYAPEPELKSVLDMLIPMESNKIYPDVCNFFEPDTIQIPADAPNQSPLQEHET